MSASVSSQIRTVTAMLLAVLPLAVLGAPPVQVNAADPSSAPQGTLSLDVTVSGSGFDSSAAVSFFVTGTTNPGGITVKKVVVNGSKRLTATIDIADTAIIDKFDVEVALSGGRKGKGTSLFAVQAKSTDPCVAAVNFPAFIFYQTTGQLGTFASDQTGQCIRFISNEFNAAAARFSYPVRDDLGNATSRGRIVIKGQNSNFEHVYTAFDITVQGTTISIGPTYVISNLGLGTTPLSGRDLSADGRYLYFSGRPEVRPEGIVNIVTRVHLPADLADLNSNELPDPVTVFEHGAFQGQFDQYTETLAVNAANDLLYVVQANAQSTQFRLLRVDLDEDLIDSGGNPEVATIPLSSAKNFSLSADVSTAGSDLLALGTWSDQDRKRYLTIMNGRTGTVLNDGTSWPGIQVSWFGGKVLTTGHYSKGPSAYSIVEVDTVTGAALPLVKGSYPEGR